MKPIQQLDPEVRSSVAQVLLGFFGVITAFLLLPKTIKYVIRRFVFGIFSEVVAVILAGLLTEKAVEKLKQGE